jgi:hemerythrin superfamily protein
MPAKKTSRKQPLAIELLMSDHRSAEQLFDQYEDEKESGDEAKRAIAERVCGELMVHAQVEEELFYPWLRENLDEEDMDLVEEATVEHQGAKDLIAQIQGAKAIDETYDAKVKVLGEYIKHHVKEEEGEIFPEVSSETEALDELGQEMAARKAELMEEMGLADADQQPPAKGGRGRGAEETRRSR